MLESEGGNILSSDVDLISYSYTMFNNFSKPDAIIRPSDPEEVSSILKSLSDERKKVFVRGNGTSFVGCPAEGGVLIETRRMDEILEIDEEDLTATVESGVQIGNLLKNLPKDLFFPIDPDGLSLSTFGGVIAEDSASPLSLAYGTAGSTLLGLEVVLPDGSLMELGSTTIGARGIESLFIGTEGSLGVITKVKIRLYRRPERLLLYEIDVPHVEDAIEMHSLVDASGIPLLGFEFYYRDLFELGGKEVSMGARVHMLLKAPQREDEIHKKIESIAEREGALKIDVEEYDPMYLPKWKGRGYLIEGLKSTCRTASFLSFTVPRDSIFESISRIDAIGSRMKLETVTMVNPGMNWILTGFTYDFSDEKEMKRAERALKMAIDQLSEIQAIFGFGTGTGTNMAGLKLKSLDNRELFERVKRCIDPNFMMNPIFMPEEE
jgi:glycolate oxidase